MKTVTPLSLITPAVAMLALAAMPSCKSNPKRKPSGHALPAITTVTGAKITPGKTPGVILVIVSRGSEADPVPKPPTGLKAPSDLKDAKVTTVHLIDLEDRFGSFLEKAATAQIKQNIRRPKVRSRIGDVDLAIDRDGSLTRSLDIPSGRTVVALYAPDGTQTQLWFRIPPPGDLKRAIRNASMRRASVTGSSRP